MFPAVQCLQEESKAVKQFKLKGKCCGKDFTDADILQGSFTVTNQCASPQEITIGAVYIGQLTATFFDLEIPRSAWVGGTITVSAGLKLANGRYEYVPIGIYTIAEAKHARSGVEVVAYDNMSKFDRLLDFDATYGTVYELLSAFCSACGVQLGMTQVPEGRRIFQELSVYENLMMGAYTIRDQQRFKADLDSIFDRFPRLKERRNQIAGTLSGGEQQMLAMSRALMSHPKLLMLDEPSMGLAPILVDQIFDIIKELHESGTTILLVEQNATKALKIADRAYVLETGRITLSGTGADLAQSDEVQKAYLGG